MRRRLVLALLYGTLGTLAAAGAACLSPTLPLPPPEEPDGMRPAAEGEDMWVIAGTCYPGAVVTVFNEETGKGSVVEDVEQIGRYSLEIRATRCDLAWVSQVVEDEASGRTSFVIQEKTGGGLADGGACK